MAYLSKKLREAVIKRANSCCEYCLIPQYASFFRYQVEHIISKKHRGSDGFDNLALACPMCNRHKGSDLGTNVGEPPVLVRFYNPRLDTWNDHFTLDDLGKISSKSNIGESTIRILQMNQQQAIEQREKLIKAGVLTVE